MKINKFTLPIYLNQKYVFDLLAIIDNGFSQMETIKTGNNSGNSESGSLKGEVGLSNTFAFLKLGVSADNKSEKSKSALEEITKDKIHTPNSLFSKMREYLQDNELVKNSSFLNSKPGDFVEIKLSLRKNPIIDSLEALLSIMKIAVSFEDKPLGNNKKPNQVQKSPSNNDTVINQIESLLNQLKEEGSLDLIGTSTGDEKFQVVLTLDKSFIGDLSLADIADGEFSVIGKVTKVLGEESVEEVNLLRKTSLSKLNNSLLDEMFSGFSNMADSGLKDLEIETVIKAPVIQLIPISIFT
jgi:hypothetical protein